MEDQKTKNIILFVATAWGPKHGGINSFNKTFCVELAKYIKQNKLDYEVYCIVYDINIEDYQEASKNDVTLINLHEKDEKSVFSGKEYGQRIYKELEKVNKLALVKYVILHDIITGDLFCHKNIFHSSEPKWAAIHHMHYNEYKHLDSYTKNLDKYEKIISQDELFTKVDFVFAVGPLLTEKLRDHLDSKNIERKSSEIIELIPGLQLETSNTDPSKRINGLVFGRLDTDHDRIKLSSLVMSAWVLIIPIKAVRMKNVAGGRLKVVGFDYDNDADKQNLTKIQEEYSRYIDPFPFIDKKKTLNYMLADSTIAFMLSRHEGFGLTGWEAIGAKIPLIVTKNSGLWKLLENNHLEKYVCGIDLNDAYVPKEPFTKDEVNIVAGAIDDYIGNYALWHKNADDLRNRIESKFTWENTSRTFLQKIGILPEENKCVDIAADDGINKIHTMPRKPEETKDNKGMSISDFAKHCVQNTHALIISHRTKIIIPIDSDSPYHKMLEFLEKFTIQNQTITIEKSSLKRTLLIFVVDFYGDKLDDEKALHNCLALQAFLKAIYLILTSGENKKFDAEASNSREILRRHFGNISDSIPEDLTVFAEDRCLLRELTNRVVIIVKNCGKYMNDVCAKEKRFSSCVNNHSHNLFYRVDNIPSDTSPITLTNNSINQMFPDFSEHHILKSEKPPLDHIEDPLLSEVINTSTNIDKADNKAFGLFSTVRFEDISKGENANVECYFFNKSSGNAKILPLDVRKTVNRKYTLYDKGIRDSMAVTCLAACHYLHEEYWQNDEAKGTGAIWEYQGEKNIIYRASYEKLKAYNFSFFTLPQYLNFPLFL